MIVSLELVGGIFPGSFSVTVTPSEKSLVSAQGNNNLNVHHYVLTEEYLTNS